MEEKKAQVESHLSSAAAFVEGGIQEACDDACSICLEEFCDSDPSAVNEKCCFSFFLCRASWSLLCNHCYILIPSFLSPSSDVCLQVTVCKHEFHLQCVLEWCQRSSQCPMCWQPISMKDPTSQELLEAVEQERNIRSNRPRNTTIFHHPMLGDFELQHLPVDVSDSELEERIIQHLAAAALGRSHLARRDGHRRSRGHGRPQYLVFSTHPNSSPISSPAQTEGASEPTPALSAANPSVPLTAVGEESTFPPPSISNQILLATSEANASPMYRNDLSNNRNSPNQSAPANEDTARSSDFQSLSESLKSRFNAFSMRYKESISKSTRGWRERLFSRNTSVADIGSEVRKEVNAATSSASRLVEHLDTGEDRRNASTSHSQDELSLTAPDNQTHPVIHTGNIPADSTSPASSAATSSSS